MRSMNKIRGAVFKKKRIIRKLGRISAISVVLLILAFSFFIYMTLKRKFLVVVRSFLKSEQTFSQIEKAISNVVSIN